MEYILKQFKIYLLNKLKMRCIVSSIREGYKTEVNTEKDVVKWELIYVWNYLFKVEDVLWPKQK